MKYLASLAVGLAMLVALPSSARVPLKLQSRQAGLVQAASRSMENAFFRKMAVLDSAGLQPSALELGSLYPTYGFAPPVNTTLTTSLTGVDEDTARECVVLAVDTTAQWNDALYALSFYGFTPANDSCGAQSSYSLAPGTWPAKIAGVKILDRNAVPVATRVPSYPGVGGVDSAAITRPGLTVNATGQAISVTNPLTYVMVGDTPVPVTLGLTGVRLRTGFSVTHNCSTIGPNGTCQLWVSYDGANGDYFVGNLHMTFSNGTAATVGLLGRTH